MIIKLFGLCSPDYLIGSPLMIDFHRQIATVIISPKFGDFNRFLLKGLCNRRRRDKIRFFLQLSGRPSARSFSLCNILINSSRCLRVLVNRNHCLSLDILLLFEFLIFHVFAGKVAEAGVRVYWRVFIFSGLVVFVFATGKQFFEMVLHD